MIIDTLISFVLIALACAVFAALIIGLNSFWQAQKNREQRLADLEEDVEYLEDAADNKVKRLEEELANERALRIEAECKYSNATFCPNENCTRTEQPKMRSIRREGL